jgi:hypothetical protein
LRVVVWLQPIATTRITARLNNRVFICALPFEVSSQQPRMRRLNPYGKSGEYRLYAQ